MLICRPGFSLALLTIATSKIIPALAVARRPLAVALRFDVSFDQSVGGNCARWGQGRLGNIISDAFDLAEAGLSAVDAAVNSSNPYHNEAYGLLATRFLDPAMSLAQYSQIRRMRLKPSLSKTFGF
jgi:hypothetical protein